MLRGRLPFYAYYSLHADDGSSFVRRIRVICAPHNSHQSKANALMVHDAAPAEVYGADFVLGLPGVRRDDAPAPA